MSLHHIRDRILAEVPSRDSSLRGRTPDAPVHIIGAASGLGAHDRGCALGPDALRHAGLGTTLQAHAVRAVWDDIVRRPVLRSGTDPISALRAYCEDLLVAMQPVLQAGRRLVVLGGDHSCAIATWSAVYGSLCGRGPVGLVWIDAHMDSHTPESSPSGALHGMPLAILLGHGPEALTGFLSNQPKLRPEHVCLLGVRSYEPEEAALLQRLGVRVITMEEVGARGLDAAFHEAFAIASRGTAGIGLSIDLDAIDPRDAPAVGTPVPEGLRAAPLIGSLRRICGSTHLIAVEVAEYNPLRDRADRTARLVCRLLAAILEGRLR